MDSQSHDWTADRKSDDLREKHLHHSSRLDDCRFAPRIWTQDRRTTNHHVALAFAPSRLSLHVSAVDSLLLRVSGRLKVEDFPCCIPGLRHVTIRSYHAVPGMASGLHERCSRYF